MLMVQSLDVNGTTEDQTWLPVRQRQLHREDRTILTLMKIQNNVIQALEASSQTLLYFNKNI